MCQTQLLKKTRSWWCALWSRAELSIHEALSSIPSIRWEGEGREGDRRENGSEGNVRVPSLLCPISSAVYIYHYRKLTGEYGLASVERTTNR